jgi:hypothetical protein
MVKDSEETILLAGDATLKVGFWRDYRIGSVYLTPTRILWRSTLPLRKWRLFASMWIPAEVAIDLAQVTKVRKYSSLSNAWLVIDVGDKAYWLRRGKSRFIGQVLDDNSATTQRWLEAIESARQRLHGDDGEE